MGSFSEHDRGPLRYAEALAMAAGTSEPGQPLRLLASTTTAEIAVFLRAYAVARGRAWAIESGSFGLLQPQLNALPATDATVVALVAVDDVFPSLTYRSDSQWTMDGLAEIAAQAWDRARKAAAEIGTALARHPGRVIVVPPALDPPLLPTPDPRVAATLGRLAQMIDLALHLELRDSRITVVDTAAVLAGIARDGWRDDALLLEAGTPLSTQAASSLASAIDEEAAGARVPRKVIVTDLDGTLWRGIISEDGVENLDSQPHGPGHVHRVWQRVLAMLRERGVLLAVCSRNDPDVADVLADPDCRSRIGLLLGPDDFAAISLSWDAKSEALRGLAGQLNLGLDSFVFVDDNPAEVAEVSSALPEVIPLRFPADARGLHEFLHRVGTAFSGSVALTDEDLRRNELYMVRKRAERDLAAAGSEADFLQSLGMRMRITPVDEASLPRAVQLINRVNQFHLTGHRFTETSLASLLAQSGVQGFTGRILDRYADHGICVVLAVRRRADAIEILEFGMSCRVLNRTVETAVLRWLFDGFGCPIIANWQPTDRNRRVRDTLAEHGFEQTSDATGTRWEATNRSVTERLRCHVTMEEGC